VKRIRVSSSSSSSHVQYPDIHTNILATLTPQRVRNDHCNSFGVVHGGLLMTMADLAASTGRGSVTVSFNANFVSSAAPVGDLLVATATCIREGRKLSFLQGSIVARNDAGDRPEVTILTFSAVMSRILAKQPDAKL
jgi:uncharacterized protein (TIGR00369 family)